MRTPRFSSSTLHRRTFLAAALGSPIALTTSAGTAQEVFAGRYITLIVPFAAGGSTDVLARLVAEGMSRNLGQQVMIENVAGAGGTIGGKRALQAPADGYTLLIGNTGTLAAYSAFHKTRPYDSTTDFAAIASVGDAPQMLVARKDFPVSSLDDFATYAKANQDKLTFGAAGAGSGSFLGGTLVNSRLGLNVRPVNFRSSGDALNGILGGNIDFMSESTTAALPFVQGRQMKAIAVLTQKRIEAAPDLAAAGESSHADMLYTVWNAIVARQGTPEPVLRRLNEAVRAALGDPNFKARTAQLGIAQPVGDHLTPSGARAMIAAESAQWAQLLASFKLTSD